MTAEIFILPSKRLLSPSILTKILVKKNISQAIEKGIKVIISENFYSEYEGITWIIVENSVKFLQDLAHYHIENHPIKTDRNYVEVTEKPS